MKEVYAQKGSGGVSSFEWCILEVPEEIALGLLNSLKFETCSENELLLTTTDFIEKKSPASAAVVEKPITPDELEAELMDMIEESAQEKDFKRALNLADGISNPTLREQTISSLKQRQSKQ